MTQQDKINALEAAYIKDLINLSTIGYHGVNEHQHGRCPECGAKAEFLVCAKCKVQRWTISCDHYAQPRPINRKPTALCLICIDIHCRTLVAVQDAAEIYVEIMGTRRVENLPLGWEDVVWASAVAEFGELDQSLFFELLATHIEQYQSRIV